MDGQYRSAICTNCGAEIRLDSSKKHSFCSNCGGKIGVSDAIRKFAVLFPERAIREGQKASEAAFANKTQPQADAAAQDGENQAPVEAAPVAETRDPSLSEQYAAAQAHLDAREYIKAADIYNKILTDVGPGEHEAHWGLFLVDERNFNTEEKLLQCFSCFPFRQGSEKIKIEILDNANLAKAYDSAPADARSKYTLEAQRHAEEIFNLYRQGCDNLIPVSEHSYGMLCNCYETVGITAASSKIGFPAGVSIRFMGDSKLYIRFATNRLNMLHMDVYNVSIQTQTSHTMWHYRHIQMTENGKLAWSEFRSFKNVDNPTAITGDLDPYNKEAFYLLGLWDEKIMVRTGNKVYFLRATVYPDSVVSVLDRCYSTVCIPVVEDPNSYNTGHKNSEFYHVSPIANIYDTAKKSKWLRKSVLGCYVATAVYGSYGAPQVRTLRRFRDDVLARSFAGRCFIRLYYRIGPVLSRFLGPDYNGRLPWPGRGIKKLLDRFVAYLDGKS